MPSIQVDMFEMQLGAAEGLEARLAFLDLNCFRPTSDAVGLQCGGEGGIRTLGTRKGTTVFETAPFDRSGTSPLLRADPSGTPSRLSLEGHPIGAGR